MKSANATFS